MEDSPYPVPCPCPCRSIARRHAATPFRARAAAWRPALPCHRCSPWRPRSRRPARSTPRRRRRRSPAACASAPSGRRRCRGRFVDLAVYEAQPHVFYAASRHRRALQDHEQRRQLHRALRRRRRRIRSARSRSTSRTRASSGSAPASAPAARARAGATASTRARDGGRTLGATSGCAPRAHIGRIVARTPTNAQTARTWPRWASCGARTRNADSIERATAAPPGSACSRWTRTPAWWTSRWIPPNPNILYAASLPAATHALRLQRRRTRQRALEVHGRRRHLAQASRTGLPAGDHGRIGIAIYREDPRIVYVSVEQGLRYTASTTYEEPQAGLYRSDDRGESCDAAEHLEPAPDVRRAR